ncbi:unnamed protein product [Rotaria sordida]|uniref:Adenosine kinase n=1 Tax=Rotaria sordida TaxID=392033 RepID=A0A814XLS2_9BILA|nr:unnamed protein product [Rotaria sordida]
MASIVNTQLRYNLQANNAVLAQNVTKYDEILKEIFTNGNYHLNYNAGGSTQNTLRTINWLLDRPNITVCMGCIGNDESGKILEEQMENCLYQKTSDSPTATCLILITEQARSMITDLGAANRFTIDYLNKSENWLYVERAKLFYIPGYFVRTCPEAVFKLARHAANTKKIFALNLSAEYICQKFGDILMQLLPFIDFLFGNEQEVKCFAQYQMKNNTNDDILPIARELQKLLIKNTKTCVIVTHGADPIILASNHGVKVFAVKRLSKIVDTIGCGDAFVGGFLAYWSLDGSIDECINAACYCAYECLSQTECQFTNKPLFNQTERFCELEDSC